MSKLDRAHLLRERFKAIGGIPFVFSGVRKPKPTPRPMPTIRMGWPEANRDTRRAGVWMHKPDLKPLPVPRPKRRNGESPLTKIAEQLPKKLPKVDWDRVASRRR